MRGDLAPRTSVLILEMLKMLIVQRTSGSKREPALDCQVSPVMISGGCVANAAMPVKTYFGVPGVKTEDARGFDRALERALSTTGPSLVEAVLG